jgi:hypothetical protein
MTPHPSDCDCSACTVSADLRPSEPPPLPVFEPPTVTFLGTVDDLLAMTCGHAARSDD